MVYFSDEDIKDCYIEGNIILIDGKEYKIAKATKDGIWVVEL